MCKAEQSRVRRARPLRTGFIDARQDRKAAKAWSGSLQTTFTISTHGRGFYEFTASVAQWVRGDGLLTLFIRHTSASLLIQENADPDVQTDLAGYLERLVPLASDASMSWLTHVVEGPEDMPAHIKAALLPVSLQIPVRNGNLRLGTWQGIYLVEHRFGSRTRQVDAHFGA